jgi:peptide/nickel transport system substrate-binding protein
MVRLVYRGYASPAIGPVSASNKVWFNRNVKAPVQDTKHALRLLNADGFRLQDDVLKDSAGNSVEFSLITNAGSKTRTQLGSIIQQDLSKIGIRVNLITLEFQSLIERITKTNNYEACLLGLTNVEVDPNSQMNIWTSSGTHHAWNPRQKTPATAWEAEIDLRMREQASATNTAARKKAFDRVQEIIAAEAPIVYLVHPNVLAGVSPWVRNASVSALPPHLYWNVEHLMLAPQPQEGR